MPTLAGLATRGFRDGVAAAVITYLRGANARTHIGRYLIVILTGVTGLLASSFMFVAIETWQTHLAELKLTGLASNHLQTINAGLKDATDLLYSLRAFCKSVDHPVTRNEYQTFSHTLRERVPGLRDTGWAPRVTRAGRAAFEREIQASGIPNFQIMDRNAEGKLTRAGERDEYFPILYSDPGEINRPVMGLNLISEPMRSRAIARARATDQPAATPPVKLMNMQRPNGGLMSFIPVNGKIVLGTEVSNPIAGVVLGAFETAAMIENILATKLHLAELNMYVFDPDGPKGNRLIYWHAANGEPAPDEETVMLAPHWQGTLEIVDQRWAAIFLQVGTPVGAMAHWNAVAVLASGLTVTASIVAYLLFSLHRTQRLEKLTIDLRETSDELRRNGAKLDHLARHDALTGLPNRIAFRDDVARGLSRARRGQDLAILYLDLDRFKAVNDTLGHPIGDRLLCQVADRLREIVRETDTITRLGGDEFAIAQFDGEQTRAAKLLARRVIETLSRPYEIEGHHAIIGVSIGITLAGPGDTDVDQLLRRADIALYAAKRDGRGTSRFFEPSMDRDAQVWRSLEMDLRHALAHDGLELYYQPQISLADGQLCGFEALLRWRHPQRGLLMPGDFIRCAEETGLMVSIGTWALRTALCQSAQWPEDWRVAVNLSPYQLARDDLAETVEAALAASGQQGQRLELEITESALLDQSTTGQEALKHLRTLGVRIALDDFGTGFVSLTHLRNFPLDRLKIDQSFVAAMTESSEGAAIVRTMLQLAAVLNIATTAEGVETQAQADLLAANSCQEAQGFLFSPACPASELSRFVANWPGISLEAVRDSADARQGSY